MKDSRDKSTAFSKTLSLRCADKFFSFEGPVVMGILNLTPDSFHDGGRYLEKEQYLGKVESMLDEGAQIIDIGAMSSRPGSAAISEDEELKRLIPALDQILKHFPGTVISIDTYRSRVAAEGAGHGASIINDISGGMFDPLMYRTVARFGLPYILMHMQGTPESMQYQPQYADLLQEIKSFFIERVGLARQAGVEQIILDPGFGFGKTLQHNYRLLKHLPEIRIEGLPLLIGLSRKSMIYKVTGTLPEGALHGTGVLNAVGLMNGADILRVHDVKEAVQAIRLIRMLEDADQG